MEGSTEVYNSDNKQKKYKYFLGIRSDRLLFIICLFIAALFWLLIKLSDIYSVNYSFALKYNNAPASLRLTRVIDSTLDISLTARGFAILKLNLFNDMETLDINLDNYTIDHKGDIKYGIFTQELTSRLAGLVNVGEKDIQLSRASLTFELEKTGSKIISIVPNYDIIFTDQFDLYEEVKLDPSEVTVYGPQSVLDSLYSISTQKLILENVQTDQEIGIELNNPNPELLSLGNNQSTLYFKVEKFTESELLVPVNLSNLKYRIKTFPMQVSVFYRVAQKDFNEVRAHQFNIIPMVDNLDILHAHKLPLKVSKHPDFVRNVRVIPSEVEFLIIK